MSKYLDKDLFGPLIGGYEIMNEYHSWLFAQNYANMPAAGKIVSEFRKHISRSFGQTPVRSM